MVKTLERIKELDLIIQYTKEELNKMALPDEEIKRLIDPFITFRQFLIEDAAMQHNSPDQVIDDFVTRARIEENVRDSAKHKRITEELSWAEVTNNIKLFNRNPK